MREHNKKERHAGRSENKKYRLKALFLGVENVFHDVFRLALKNSAQIIDGGRGYRLVFPQLVNGGAGNMMPGDQGVGRLRGGLQCFPKTPVNNHSSHSFLDASIVGYDFYLDYSRNNDYNDSYHKKQEEKL